MTEGRDAAVKWCEAHGARTIWSQDERSCRIEVRLPDRRYSVVFGEGPTFLDAIAAVRAAYEEFYDGPPTKRLVRP